MTELSFIQALGYVGVFFASLAESGLLIGILLPGDSILVTSGLLASQGYISFIPLLIAAFLGAILGDSLSYSLGSYFGPKIFHREDSFLFHKDHLVKAREFFRAHGSKTVFLARFIPFIRSVAPLVAGAGKMPYRTFVLWNILGGLFWACGLVTAGYALGHAIPNLQQYIGIVIACVLFFFIVGPVVNILRDKESRGYILAAFRKIRRK